MKPRAEPGRGRRPGERLRRGSGSGRGGGCAGTHRRSRRAPEAPLTPPSLPRVSGWRKVGGTSAIKKKKPQKAGSYLRFNSRLGNTRREAGTRGSANSIPLPAPLAAGTAAAPSLGADTLPSRRCGPQPPSKRGGGTSGGGHCRDPSPAGRRGSAAPRPRRERRAGQLLPATFPPPSTTRVRVRGVCAPVYRRGPGAGQPPPAGANGRSGVSAAAAAEAEGRSHRGRGGLGAPPPPPARPDLTRGGRRLPQAPPASPLGGRPRGARGGARSPEAEPRSPPDRLLGRARVDGREKRCETHLVSPPPSCATRHRVQRDETAASSRTGTVKNSRRKD